MFMLYPYVVVGSTPSVRQYDLLRTGAYFNIFFCDKRKCRANKVCRAFLSINKRKVSSDGQTTRRACVKKDTWGSFNSPEKFPLDVAIFCFQVG